MSERGPEIVEKVISLAMEGDTTCLKMCLDRILPPKRDVEIKHEGGQSINIVVEQIGTQAQEAITDVGGQIIEHNLGESVKAATKANDAAYDAISVSVLEEEEDQWATYR